MPRPRQPTAFVFCIAEHPVFSALLTVCREVAASGRGLRSAADYRRWWFVVTAAADSDRLNLPPDAPELEGEEFIPGFIEGVVELLTRLDGVDDIVPIVGDRRPWYTCSHSRLTEEPLEDYLRERGFEVLRPRDLLARNRRRPSGGNDVFEYRGCIADALANAELTISTDDRLAFGYVLGELDELPATLSPSEVFFESVPSLTDPSEWCVHDHRHFDVLCAARAFERIPGSGYDVTWAESFHAWARELGRRGAPPLQAIRSVFAHARSLAEDLELVAASVGPHDSWTGDRRVFERELDEAKRDLVAIIKDLVFDEVGTTPAAATAIAEPPRPRANHEQRRVALESGYYNLCSAWGQDRLLIVIGYPNLVLRSTDAGDTWSLDQFPINSPQEMDGARLDDGRELIVAVGNEVGVAWSWDGGQTWESSGVRSRFRAVAVAPDGRVCAVGRRVWAVSRDPGELLAIEQPIAFEDVDFDGARFLAVAIDGSVLVHEDDGWRPIARLDAAPRAIAAREGVMMVLAEEGCATSVDGGQSWSWSTDDWLRPAYAAAITPDGRRHVVARRAFTSDDGERWRLVPVADIEGAHGVALTEHAVVIISWNSIGLVGRESSTTLRFGSAEFAACPEQYPVAEHGFTLATLAVVDETSALFAEGDRLVLATDEGLLVSEDRGRSFVPAAAPRGRPLTSIVEYGGELWAACEGVLRSADGGRSWAAVEAPQITELLVTKSGELFAVRGEWLLRRDLRERSGWRTCRRFEQDIDVLVSDASGTVYVVADTLHASDDGGASWRSSPFAEDIVGLVASSDGLLACDRLSLHVSHDHGRSFEPHPLPLHVDSRWRGQVHSFRGSASGDLYFATDHFMLHSADLGRTLARVRAPFANTHYVLRSIVENGGCQYLMIDSKKLLERVDGSAIPEPRFIEV
jgi:photosystem II stability/assembly factor-like uncharacterized protein